MVNLAKIKNEVKRCKIDLGITWEEIRSLAERLGDIEQKLKEIEKILDKKT